MVKLAGDIFTAETRQINSLGSLLVAIEP